MWPSSNIPPNQWTLNPAAYQNIPSEHVDWAALAQQWMKMKEAIPAVNSGPLPPQAPQAPQISKTYEDTISKQTLAAPEPQSTNDIEGGEAPMDMDTKDDEAATLTVDPNSSSNWNQWNNWQSMWGWGWTGNAGTVPLGEKTPSSTSDADSKVKSLNSDSIPIINNYISDVGKLPSMSTAQVPGSFNYNSIAGGIIPPLLPKLDGYNENTFHGKPGLESWNRNNRMNVTQKTITEPCPGMDNNKKKQLPAWIREGLSKMEREKQKKMERERMLQDKGTNQNIMFDEKESATEQAVLLSPIVRDESGNESSALSGPSCSPSPERINYQPRYVSVKEKEHVIRKTKDQIMEESMLQVRRILTQFLLEATEHQVLMIAKEELRKKKSAPAPQMRKHHVSTSVSGNLGLDVYGSGSESPGSNSGRSESEDEDTDSDGALKMQIEKKQRNFALIEDEINEQIECQEIRERQITERSSEYVEKTVKSSSIDRNSEKRGNHRSVVNTPNTHGESFECETAVNRSDEPKNSKIVSNMQSNIIKSISHDHRIDKQNGVDTEEKSNSHKNDRRDNKPSYKSKSSTSSSSSSSSSSSENSSSDSESSSSRHGCKNRRRNRSKDSDKKRYDKRSRYRSRSKSRSRPRLSIKKSGYRSQSGRSKRDRSSSYRRSSSTREKHSSSRRDSKDGSASKYSKTNESNSSRKIRRRSSSRESRYAPYKRR